MPLTSVVFDNQEMADDRRAIIEAAVVEGAKHLKGEHEAWIVADRAGGGIKVLITGPQGFERMATFALDEDPVLITECVRQTLRR